MNIDYGYADLLGFSQGSGSVSVGYLNCDEQDENLLKCSPNYQSTNSYCQNHNYDAGVICES